MAGFYAAVDRFRHASLDGLTVREHQERAASEILKNSPPDIHESFEIDCSYRYGKGLHIVLDAPVIDRSVIEHAIVKFREAGEAVWVSDAPIPRSHLPEHTEAEAMAVYREQTPCPVRKEGED